MAAQNSGPETTSNRRNVLVGAIYAFVSLIGASLGIPAVLYLFVPPKARNQGIWIDAGRLDQYEPDKPQEISFRRNRANGWKITSEKATAWLVKDTNSRVQAFSPSCTHLGCAVHWEDSQNQFVCPCHGSFFAMNGKVIAGPAPRPLDQFEVRLEGNRVWLGPVRQSTEVQS